MILPHGGEAKLRGRMKSGRCDEIDAMYSSHVPILFKKCLKRITMMGDFIFFPDKIQNLFPACVKISYFVSSLSCRLKENQKESSKMFLAVFRRCVKRYPRSMRTS
mmetsp:Transcript_32836/g.38007  ORF Transcript_32836/g.38007 Transcript_32836/m.38007 type:complete len:106 (-) Transcript_32836:67-384(-)